MKIEIICTVGPSILLHDKLREISKEGVTILRVNGAHGEIDYIHSVIKKVHSAGVDTKILLDLPCNKIRTKNIISPIELEAGEIFILDRDQVNYDGLFTKLKKGDRILSADSQLLFEVVECNSYWSKFQALSSGVLGNNKGLHVSGIYDDIPYLFRRDKELIDLALSEGVDYLGLSFVRDGSDIQLVKEMLGSSYFQPTIISKIETKKAVENLSEILKQVDYILIDRGDLSAEIGIEELPTVQHALISYAKSQGKKVYLATQFLFHMINHRLPLIAEINEIYNVLQAGISGIQLSEETAVGKYPVECVRLVKHMANKI